VCWIEDYLQWQVGAFQLSFYPGSNLYSYAKTGEKKPA